MTAIAEAAPARVPPRHRVVREAMRDPLLRRGHALTLSAGITSVIGFGYWALAARYYDTATVGRNAAAISAMMFLGGVAQLNMMSALVRFLPTAGRSSRTMVAAAYLISLSVALVVCGCFLLTVHAVVPGLRFLTDTPAIAALFLLSTMAWTVFNLQDSVLTGLRRTWMVPTENAAFSVAKILLVVALAGTLPRTGILVSWSIALALSLLPTNRYVFKRAIPYHLEHTRGHASPATPTEIVHFVAADYLGSMFWVAATSLIPLLVLAERGATASAYFALSWIIAYAFFLVSANMGVSMVVETAADQSRLRARCIQVIRHTFKVVLPAALAVIVIAPHLLDLFGHEYGRHGATVLRLLVAAAVGHVVVANAVSAARSQRRIRVSNIILGAVCGLVFLLSAALLPLMGIAGVGLAWLIAEGAAAVTLLVTKESWLPAGPVLASSRAAAPELPSPRPWVRRTVAARRTQRRARHLRTVLPQILAAAPTRAGWPPVHAWDDIRIVPTVSALTVAKAGITGQLPCAVIRLAPTPLAASQLEQEGRVLDGLRRDGRVGDWQAFLPEIAAAGGHGAPRWSIESCVDGCDGESIFSGGSSTAQHAIEISLATIGELHRRTSTERFVDGDLVNGWLLAPSRTVAAAFRPHSWQRGALAALAEEIPLRLLARQATVCWTHGDFTPGNILFAPNGAAVRAIIDWGQASPAGLPELDIALLLMTVRSLRERRELGSVVRDLLREPDWPEPERRLLPDVQNGIGHRDVVLMAWLNHVAGNLGKAEHYRRNPLWVGANINTVLQEAWP